MNNRNFIGWLTLASIVLDIPDEQREAIKRYIRRTDYTRRQKEIDDIFGGEEWLILRCVNEEIAQDE